MERGARSLLGTVVKGVLVVGGFLVAAKAYVALVPHSAALGAIIVIGAGAALAFVVLHVDRLIDDMRSDPSPADAPPGP
jgi:hypothetical protein